MRVSPGPFGRIKIVSSNGPGRLGPRPLLAYPLMTWGTATDLSPSTPNSRP
jgi:hypothetical protein